MHMCADPFWLWPHPLLAVTSGGPQLPQIDIRLPVALDLPFHRRPDGIRTGPLCQLEDTQGKT